MFVINILSSIRKYNPLEQISMLQSCKWHCLVLPIVIKRCLFTEQVFANENTCSSLTMAHQWPCFIITIQVYWSQVHVPAPLFLTVSLLNHIHQSLLLYLILSTSLYFQAHIHHCLAIHLFVYPIFYPAMYLVAVSTPLSLYSKHFHILLPLLHLFIYKLLKYCCIYVSLHSCAMAGCGEPEPHQ